MVYYWTDTESSSSASRCITETINFDSPTDDLAKLKTKVMDIEGRSHRNSIPVHIFCLPETIESPHQSIYFMVLLVEVFCASLESCSLCSPKPGERPRDLWLFAFTSSRSKILSNLSSWELNSIVIWDHAHASVDIYLSQYTPVPNW